MVASGATYEAAQKVLPESDLVTLGDATRGHLGDFAPSLQDLRRDIEADPQNLAASLAYALANPPAVDPDAWRSDNVRYDVRRAKDIDKQDGIELRDIAELIASSEDRGNKRGKQRFYRLSKTSDIVKHILTGDYFTIKRSTILEHKGKDYDHALTDDDWRNISEALHDPLVIAKYSFRSQDGIVHRPANAYSVWVEAVINGHFAMVGVKVKSPSKNITVISVNTIYGDENITLNEEDVVYSRENGEGLRTFLGGPKPREYSETPHQLDSIPYLDAAAQECRVDFKSGKFVVWLPEVNRRKTFV